MEDKFVLGNQSAKLEDINVKFYNNLTQSISEKMVKAYSINEAITMVRHEHNYAVLILGVEFNNLELALSNICETLNIGDIISFKTGDIHIDLRVFKVTSKYAYASADHTCNEMYSKEPKRFKRVRNGKECYYYANHRRNGNSTRPEKICNIIKFANE